MACRDVAKTAPREAPDRAAGRVGAADRRRRRRGAAPAAAATAALASTAVILRTGTLALVKPLRGQGAPVAEGSSHGWRPYDPGALPEGLATRGGQELFSDIPVLDGSSSSLPSAAGPADVPWQERPFLLRGTPSLLSQRHDLSRDALLEAAEEGNLSTSVGYSWSIAQNGGSGPLRVPLSDYLTSMMDEALYDGERRLEPAYAFDRELRLPGLPTEIPPAIASWNETAFSVPHSASRIVMLGGPGSAVGWHRHGSAVQMTLHGWKRWFFYPSGRYPPGDGPGGGFSLTDWLEKIYPSLPKEQRPLECIQQPGDTVYVPDGWYHGVINLADSLAVSVQSNDIARDPAEAPCAGVPLKDVSLELVEHLRRESPGALAQIEEAARREMVLHPESDIFARKALFYLLLGTDRERAVQVIMEATARDPWHVPMQYELVKWLQADARAGDRFALRALSQALRVWEPYLKRNSRNLKALWILSKYYKLTGQDSLASKYHRRLVDLYERGIDR